jgi:maltose O-acetyltransferase
MVAAPTAAEPHGPAYVDLSGRSQGDLHPRLLAVDMLFGLVPHFVANRVRTQALRTAGIRIGKVTAFFGLPTLLGTGNVQERLRIGDYCGFNKGAIFDLEAPITIGNHVAVGHDVMFLTSTYETGTSARRAGKPICAPITIGDGVWLGARATVLAGVTIGAGSVIGAGVVVTSNIPENTLFVGAQRVSIARWR